MPKQQTPLNNPETLKFALRAIYEASWRLDTILKELPGSPKEVNGEGDTSRLPEILKEHGATCLSAIWNALETIDNTGIDVNAADSGADGADMFDEAFDAFKKGPVPPLELAKAS
jgi:hypothetical protein